VEKAEDSIYERSGTLPFYGLLLLGDKSEDKQVCMLLHGPGWVYFINLILNRVMAPRERLLPSDWWQFHKVI
jgi:hypothetical protein